MYLKCLNALGSKNIKGIQETFEIVNQSSFGKVLMAITAVGFISYGAFYVILTRYRSFEE